MIELAAICLLDETPSPLSSSHLLRDRGRLGVLDLLPKLSYDIWLLYFWRKGLHFFSTTPNPIFLFPGPDCEPGEPHDTIPNIFLNHVLVLHYYCYYCYCYYYYYYYCIYAHTSGEGFFLFLFTLLFFLSRLSSFPPQQRQGERETERDENREYGRKGEGERGLLCFCVH